MKKRVLSMLTILALCLTLLPVTALAVAPEGVWTDYAADSFAGGSGTEDDPYQIATAAQLAKLSKDVSAGTSYHWNYFILTDDIDLSAHRWSPIGIYKWEDNGSVTNKSFQGFLDGNDKTISGMYVDETDDKNSAGLFGYINIQKNGAEVGVKDLTVADAVVIADENGLNECSAGILAARVLGTSTQSIMFENITVSGSVTVTMTYGMNNIGGMLGNVSWAKVTNCHADGVSVSGGSNSGGFAGLDGGTVYENCTASGTVDGTWAVGGFVGYSTSAKWLDPAGASTYTKCAADVDVDGSDWRVGGFAGYAEYGNYENCVSYGDVSSSVAGWNPKVGGFFGEDSSDANVTACHMSGAVTSVSADYAAGGFIGTYSGGTFSGCSFDSEKNPGLNAAGEGTVASGVTGEESAVVLANICEDYFGGHQYSSEWMVETAATCTEAGSKYHPCERCGAKGDITEIPATGHSYGAPVWSWSEDGKSCTVTFTCENDPAHQETPEVTVTSEVKTPATSTQNGVTEYTATTTFEGTTYTATKEVADIPATGFDYIGVYTYAITVPSDVDGGTVTASLTRASVGATVTLTVTPDEGYELDKLTVTDVNGSAMELTRVSDTKYSFKMPGSNVRVEAEFALIKPDYASCDGGADCPLRAYSDASTTAWYHDGVHYCLANGLMEGVDNALFAPDAGMTRAMVWAILARLDGESVTGANWAEAARAWAMAEGVSDGTDADGLVTREQLVTMLWRFSGSEAVTGSLTGFTDYAAISDWAGQAMLWATVEGIIEGDENGLINPTATATRAQAATMLMRFCEG